MEEIIVLWKRYCLYTIGNILVISKNMAKYIGRQISVGFWKETTRGTAVAVGAFVPKTDLSFDEKMETIQDESSIGVINDAKDSHVVKRWAEGDIAGNVEVNSFGYALLSVFGTVNTTVASTGAYEHVFTLNNTNQTQSLTIGVSDPVVGDVSYPLAMIDSMTITSEIGALTVFSLTFKSKQGTSTTHTVIYPTDYKLLSRFAEFKVASNLAWLDGATPQCIQSFEITFNKNLEDDYCLSSISPRDFVNKQFGIEGSFTAVFEDEATYRDIALAGSKRAIRFALIDTDTTIGTTSNPELVIDLPNCAFTEWSKTQGNDEVVIQTLTFKWLYSVADSSAVNVTLVNTKATY